MEQLINYKLPEGLAQFKKDIAGKRILILFFSATLEPTANVLCVEVSIEAFEILIKSHKVISFIAEIGSIVTIEKIETVQACFG